MYIPVVWVISTSWSVEKVKMGSLGPLLAHSISLIHQFVKKGNPSTQALAADHYDNDVSRVGPGRHKSCGLHCFFFSSERCCAGNFRGLV